MIQTAILYNAMLHELLMYILFIQCVWLGLTTGKRTSACIRRAFYAAPLCVGVWLADVSYFEYRPYFSDTAILIGFIFTLHALRKIAAKCEQCNREQI